MRGKKTDIEKRVDISISKLTNPNLSTRDIADEFDTSKSNVARIIEEELGQVGTTEKGKELFDYNLDIINDGARKVAIAMKTMDPDDIREAKEMQSIVETAFKQNLLIQGKATEIKEVKLDMSKATEDQLDEEIKNLL